MTLNNPTFSQLLRDPRLFLAFGFGSGLSRIMPGTCGTLASLPVYFLLSHLHWSLYAIAVVVSFFVGNYLCGYAAKKMKVHDHGGIVWDEFVGMWITLFLVPGIWQWVLVGFLLFRFFDMVKPWPISVADKKLTGGFGIMFDDVLAGVAAWICLQLLLLGNANLINPII